MASPPPADRITTLEDKVDVLTVRVGVVETKIDALTVRVGAVETKIDVLTAEMRASDDETRRYMRVLHEEVLERIRTLGESRF